ncbi:MAG TPA: hypothetical protein VJZ00_11820 [Thermoanaerobaculia bacterium]|nr:hypothetical protein [Thermoanaerobaculia bacterium]
MLIQALPLRVSPGRLNTAKNNARDGDSDEEGFIVVGPIVIHTYGYIGSSPAVEPRREVAAEETP